MRALGAFRFAATDHLGTEAYLLVFLAVAVAVSIELGTDQKLQLAQIVLV